MISSKTLISPSMATLNILTSYKHLSSTKLFSPSRKLVQPSISILSPQKRGIWVAGSLTEDRKLVPVKNTVSKDQNESSLLNGSNESDPASSSVPSREGRGGGDGDDGGGVSNDKERIINAAVVLGFGTLAVSRLLTIDHDYWHGWTIYEVLRYLPEHNWIAYEQALKANPILAKMAISGIVYSIGDWIAQCYEGKRILEFDRSRVLRSGLVGFTLHGSLSHFYYQFCETLFPFQDWWVVPAKVAFDQTVWSAVWNSIYYVVLGLLRFDSPDNIFSELQATFWPMLTAGWKLWPFAHLITYGVIPVEQRLLWVDCICIELIWVTILSTYSNEKSETRISDSMMDANSSSSGNASED